MHVNDLQPRFSCLFCRDHLGQNDLVEHCAVGRRLAYDESKGRLWIVCPHCGSWNLTPLDDRWEAIEECERLFRKTRARVCTENISMAVVYASLELIRIGSPYRQELAVWRYANELRGRRKRALFKAGARVADRYGWMIGAGGLVGAGFALLVGAPAAIGIGMMAGAGTEEIFREIGPEKIEKLLGQIIAKVKITRLDFSFVRTGHVPDLRVAARGEGWRLELPHSVGWEGYEGEQATHVLGLMLPIANGFGASESQVTEAVKELEDVGDAEQYVATTAQRLERLGLGQQGVGQYPISTRLALEMAAHEETERHALRGKLKWLERRWREAEEIAEIADNLFTTSADESRIAELRG